jgi:hypothetical protein
MASTLLRAIFLRPTRIVVLAVLGGVLFVWVDGLSLREVVRQFSSLDKSLMIALLLFFPILFVVALAKGVYFLFKRDKFAALCNFAAACIVGVFVVWSRAIGYDPFTYKVGPHSDIAEIYNQRRSEFNPSTPQVVNSSPRMFALGDQCRPPSGCGCWLLLDPQHTSDVERELGRGWHRPTAFSIFPQDEQPPAFTIVYVRQIDPNAYAVLGCSLDWTALRP